MVACYSGRVLSEAAGHPFIEVFVNAPLDTVVVTNADALVSEHAAALAAVVVAPQFVVSKADAASGVNVGSLNCNVAGGVGFIFGSSKEIACVFTKPDGTAERYHGDIDKYGVDIGFTKEAHMVWLVFAPGQISKGAIAGQYVGATASATAGVAGTVSGAVAAVLTHFLTAPLSCTRTSVVEGSVEIAQRQVCSRIALPDVHSLGTTGANVFALALAIGIGIAIGVIVGRVSLRSRTSEIA